MARPVRCPGYHDLGSTHFRDANLASMNGARAEGSAAEDQAAMNAVGDRIRQKRRAKGLTLVALAQMSDLSQPFLSQVERGKARPSMESLHRLARALETTTPVLLSSRPGCEDKASRRPEIDDESVSLVRANQGSLVTNPAVRARALVSGERSMSPLLFLVDETEYGDYFEHNGDELIHVISGNIEVDLDGRPAISLGQSDTLYYAGGIRHRWRALGAWPAQLLVVQSTPAELNERHGG